jgi:hypothetical protein
MIHNARFLKIIVTYPLIITLESIGLVILAWLVVTYHLYRWENLLAFLVSGRLPQVKERGKKRDWIEHGGRAS